jgi:hypothetical protein
MRVAVQRALALGLVAGLSAACDPPASESNQAVAEPDQADAAPDGDASQAPDSAAQAGAEETQPSGDGPPALPEVRPVPSRTPTVVPDRPVVEGGTLEVAAVEAAVGDVMGRITTCYSDAMVRDVNAGGKAELRFTVEAEGVVVAAKVESASLDEQTKACIAAVLMTLRFTARDQPSSVRYPMSFAPG